MKKKIIKYLVIGGIALANLVLGAGVLKSINERNVLEKTNYVAKSNSNMCGISFYAYDDDKNGKIDRIEEVGMFGIAPRGQFPIRRTYLNGEPNFDFYLTQVKNTETNYQKLERETINALKDKSNIIKIKENGVYVDIDGDKNPDAYVCPAPARYGCREIIRLNKK